MGFVGVRQEVKDELDAAIPIVAFEKSVFLRGKVQGAQFGNGRPDGAGEIAAAPDGADVLGQPGVGSPAVAAGAGGVNQPRQRRGDAEVFPKAVRHCHQRDQRVFAGQKVVAENPVFPQATDDGTPRLRYAVPMPAEAFVVPKTARRIFEPGLPGVGRNQGAENQRGFQVETVAFQVIKERLESAINPVGVARRHLGPEHIALIHPCAALVQALKDFNSVLQVFGLKERNDLAPANIAHLVQRHQNSDFAGFRVVGVDALDVLPNPAVIGIEDVAHGDVIAILPD